MCFIKYRVYRAKNFEENVNCVRFIFLFRKLKILATSGDSTVSVDSRETALVLGHLFWLSSHVKCSDSSELLNSINEILVVCNFLTSLAQIRFPSVIWFGWGALREYAKWKPHGFLDIVSSVCLPNIWDKEREIGCSQLRSLHNCCMLSVIPASLNLTLHIHVRICTGAWRGGSVV